LDSTAATSKSYPICPVQRGPRRASSRSKPCPSRDAPRPRRGVRRCKHSVGEADLRLAERKRGGSRRGVRAGLKGLRVRERYRCRRAASIARWRACYCSPRSPRDSPTPKSRACMQNADSKGGSSLSERRARPLDSPVRSRCDRDPRPDPVLSIYDLMGGSNVPA